MRIDVYHHLDGTALAGINDVLTLLRGLNSKQEIAMGLLEDINAKLDQAGTSIGNIAADVTALKDEIATLLAGGAGISQSDGEGILARVTTLADSVAAIDLSTP